MVIECVFKALLWGDIFSQCGALHYKHYMIGLPLGKSLSFYKISILLLLALVYPPSASSITLPHCGQHLALTPFL